MSVSKVIIRFFFILGNSTAEKESDSFEYCQALRNIMGTNKFILRLQIIYLLLKR